MELYKYNKYKHRYLQLLKKINGGYIREIYLYLYFNNENNILVKNKIYTIDEYIKKYINTDKITYNIKDKIINLKNNDNIKLYDCIKYTELKSLLKNFYNIKNVENYEKLIIIKLFLPCDLIDEYKNILNKYILNNEKECEICDESFYKSLKNNKNISKNCYLNVIKNLLLNIISNKLNKLKNLNNIINVDINYEHYKNNINNVDYNKYYNIKNCNNLSDISPLLKNEKLLLSKDTLKKFKDIIINSDYY